MTKLKRGDVVLYVPFPGCSPKEYERGIVKSVCDDGEHVFVLYDTTSHKYEQCDLDHYTAARTAISDLRRGKGGT
jgi:hypothetical protein